MIKKKIKYNILRTELDILESNLVSFETGKKDIKQAIQAIKTFRKEISEMF